jgi:NhaP-type Na+/H+ or K+/H+ antiporter
MDKEVLFIFIYKFIGCLGGYGIIYRGQHTNGSVVAMMILMAYLLYMFAELLYLNGILIYIYVFMVAMSDIFGIKEKNENSNHIHTLYLRNRGTKGVFAYIGKCFHILQGPKM